jgi:hypothetical protein
LAVLKPLKRRRARRTRYADRYDADGRVVAEKLYGLDSTTLQQTLDGYTYDGAGNLMSYKQASQAGTSTAFDPSETDYKSRRRCSDPSFWSGAAVRDLH